MLRTALLLLLPSPLWAQHTDTLLRKVRSFYDLDVAYILTAEDSIAFARFREAFEQAGAGTGTAEANGAYRLAWIEAREGGTVRIVRGDGRSLLDATLHPPKMRFAYPVTGPVHVSDRFAALYWDLPTGLIRYEHWYFERVE